MEGITFHILKIHFNATNLNELDAGTKKFKILKLEVNKPGI